MKRFKLTIAYDGAAYYGWQVQPRQVTVQQRVEESVQQLFPEVKRVHSSSRTDTGVHALGMVAHVDLPMDERPEEVATLLHRSADTAKEMLETNRDKLVALAEALVEREILDDTEIAELIGPAAADQGPDHAATEIPSPSETSS